MRKKKNKINNRKLRIRINPERSPLKLIMKNLENSGKSIDKEISKENIEETPVGFIERIDQLSRKVQILDYEEEHDQKQYQLLKMMYKDDVSSEHATNILGISENELMFLVDQLVDLGYLKYNSYDEVEITEDGISYLKWRELNFEN